MSLSLPQGRPMRRSGVWLRQVSGENAVYDPTMGSVHLLNDSALAIWHLCDGDIDPEEMVAAICELSRMHRDVVSEDVERVLNEFEAAGLLEWKG